MPTKLTTRQGRRSARPPDESRAADRQTVVRAMVESIGREMHLPRGVPSSPGQSGYDAWRASRERLLHYQLDMLAEEARERGVRGSRA
jgi:hypothetical protein